MNTLYIRNVSDETMQKIDEIAAERKLTRNQLVLEIVNDYVVLQNKNLHKLLPLIVQSEVKEELRKFESSIKDNLNMLLIATLRLQKTNEKLNSFLFPQLEELNINGLNIEQILAIINSEMEESDDDIIEEYFDDEVAF